MVGAGIVSLQVEAEFLARFQDLHERRQLGEAKTKHAPKREAGGRETV